MNHVEHQKPVEIRVDSVDVAGVLESAGNGASQVRMLRPFPDLVAKLPDDLRGEDQVVGDDHTRAGLVLLYRKALAYTRERDGAARTRPGSGRLDRRSYRNARKRLQEGFVSASDRLDERLQRGDISKETHARMSRRLRRKIVKALQVVARAERDGDRGDDQIVLSESDRRLLGRYFGDDS